MELLDAFGGLGAERARVAELFAAFREAEDRLHAARAETVEESELAFLRDLVQRVDKADLREGEDEDLRTEYEVLANGRRLLELAGACEQGLGDTDGTPLAMLSSLYSVLQEVADLDPERGGGFLAQLEEAMTSLQELGADLGTYAEQVDLDQQRLGEVEERLDLINRLKRRHGPTIEDVLARAEQARETLARADDRTRRLAELEQDLSRCERLCREAARHLHEQREAATGGLADAIEAKLKRLSFVQSLFRVELTEAPLSPAGCDRVEFCFSPNPGEGTRPLRQIASSGEMARVMLAVKTVLSEADQIPILVFDEVDANIGGRVAGTVAEEMRGIAGRHQVLCVTHQPQIAAAGQHHFRVQKSVAGDRTRTEVVRIEGQERLLEITRMLGAETTSDTAQAHARELLTQDWSPSPVQGLDRT
jgi:DNA repair protein RecN (Recombination protein N)